MNSSVLLSPHQRWLDQRPERDAELAGARVVEVQRADGRWQFKPAPPRPCVHCSGSGIMVDEELQLEGLCPECGGYGEI